MALSAGSAFVTVKPLFSKGAWASAGKIAATGFGIAAVAGIGAIKLAADFEDSMSKIVGLVGISRKQVDAWSKDILDLSKKLPQSPKELADAMFFITSAGLRGKTALDALTVSAHASAAGLGDTVAVADAVTSAMNAYGQKNLTAAHATDILVAAVREGKLAAGSLAPVIGKVLPIAKAMGVGFDEVAGSMALMSKSGTDAAQSATQVTAILGTFAKPTTQMIDALKKMHLSLDDVRTSLADKGMVPTLAMLRDEAKKAGVDLSKVFGNKRALTGVLQLTGNLKETNSVMHGVADSSGSLDKAFDEASKTAKFKFKSALSSLQVVGIKLGNQMLPAAARGADKFSSALDKVSAIAKNVSTFMAKIPGPVKSVGVQMLIASVALVKINAALVTGRARFTAWTATLGGAEAQLTRTQRAGAVFGAGMKNLAGAGGMLALIHGTQESNKGLGTLETTLGGAATGFAVGGPIGAAIGGLGGLFLGLARQIKGSDDAVKTSLGTWKAYKDTLDDVTGAVTEATRKFALQRLQQGDTLKVTRDAGLQDRQVVNAIVNGGKARDQVVAALGREKAALESTMTAAKAKLDADLKISNQDSSLTSEQQAAAAADVQADRARIESLKDLTKTKGAAITAVLAELGAVDKSVKAKRNDIAANKDYGHSLDALPDKKRISVETIGIIPTKRGIADVAEGLKATPKEIKTLIKASGVQTTVADVQKVIDKDKEFGRQRPVAKLYADTSSAMANINALIAAIGRIHDKHVTISTTNATVAEAHVKKARGGPVVAGRTYLVGEEGPELWRAPNSGTILPHRQTMAALSRSAFRDPARGELVQRSLASTGLSRLDFEQASYRGMSRALSASRAVIMSKSNLDELSLLVGAM